MKKRSDWSVWSAPQLRVLLALDFAVPLHETHLRRNHHVRGATITALIKAGMVERTYLVDRRTPSLPGMPFLSLTQAGEAVKRDHVLWHREIKARLGSLPAAMQAIAETRI